ncbi:hypothetical protein CYMTET_29050 [Cymbomonas tetramitiformis]|uniref:Uncharacterized protein n=1 Tax=Cymbomonas tetramitiformis TaxID=36881 RepID=A0AAE0FLR5_9CHLO|nr:hypothetical protein CYMTET_29050 [Cymbomonas tetramitiformis]
MELDGAVVSLAPGKGRMPNEHSSHVEGEGGCLNPSAVEEESLGEVLWWSMASGNPLWEMPNAFQDSATFTFEIVNDGRIANLSPPKPPSPVPPRRPSTASPVPPPSSLLAPTPEASDDGSKAKSKWESPVLLSGVVMVGAALLMLGCQVNCSRMQRRLRESRNGSRAAGGSCKELPGQGAAEGGRLRLQLWDSSQEANLDMELDAPRLAQSTPEQRHSTDALRRSESAMTNDGAASDSQASAQAQSSTHAETKSEESGNRIWNVIAIPQRADVNGSTELRHIAPTMASLEHDAEIIIVDTKMSSQTPRNSELLQIRTAWSTCPSPADSLSSSKGMLDELMDDHKRDGVDPRQQVSNKV